MSRPFTAILLLVPAASLATLAGLSWGPGTWWGQTLYVLGKLWLLAIPAFWHLVLLRQKPSLSPPRRGGLLPGLVLGVLTAAAILATYALITHRHLINPAALRHLAAKNHLTDPGLYLAFAAWTTLINALLEEYVWRWFLVEQWERALSLFKAGGSVRRDPSAPATPAQARATTSFHDPIGLFTGSPFRLLPAALAAACFTLHHTFVLALYFPPAIILLGSLGVFTGGFIWSALFARYRSIWPGYLAHVCADIAIFLIGYTLIFRG